VIALKYCRVSEFNGKQLNASDHRDDVYVEVRHIKALQLAEMVTDDFISKVESISNTGHKPDLFCSVIEMLGIVENMIVLK
jgi:hypothetical protein